MEKSWVEIPTHGHDFIEQGYCIVPAQSLELVTRIRSQLVQGLRKHARGGDELSDEAYLNGFHRFADPNTLNDARVKVHQEVGASEAFKRAVFECIREPLSALIGTEIAMQRQVNFVVHMPNDPANLIYLHTDSWSGCSPYEVILWLPLVDVRGTKSMFICSRGKNQKHLEHLRDGAKLDTAAELLEKVRPDTHALEMKFGQALLFSPTLLHGAVENKTVETRFVLNVRFKSLFSPYGAKALGETFLPLNYLPATEIGLSYESDFGIVR